MSLCNLELKLLVTGDLKTGTLAMGGIKKGRGGWSFGENLRESLCPWYGGPVPWGFAFMCYLRGSP